MYCNQCGNIVSEDALFCSFCGANTRLVSVTSATPASEKPVAVQPEYPAVSEPIQSFTAQASEPVQPASAAEVITPAYTTEQSIPAPQPAPVPAQEGIKLTQPENVKVEKYYTLGHIMLCLAAVAVMAITAGVFAGLYFSVI